MTLAPQVRIIQFGSMTCGACASMDKARVLERFVEAHPEVVVLKLEIADKKGHSPSLRDATNPHGIDFKKNYKLSDEYDVTALPTLVMEVKGVGEVVRIEGAATLKHLNEAYETTLAIAERSKLIPW